MERSFLSPQHVYLEGMVNKVSVNLLQYAIYNLIRIDCMFNDFTWPFQHVFLANVITCLLSCVLHRTCQGRLTSA